MSLMTRSQGEALVYLATFDEPVTAARIGEDLAQDHHLRAYSAAVTRGYTMLRELAAFRLVHRASRNAWMITERGRIAAVLFMARNPGMAEAFFEEDWASPSITNTSGEAACATS